MKLFNTLRIQLKQLSLQVICQKNQIQRRHISGNQQPAGGSSFRRFLHQRPDTLVELANRISMAKFMCMNNAVSVLWIPCATTKGPVGC